MARKTSQKTNRRITLPVARRIAAAALDKKAVDVCVMNVRKLTSVTDFFIVCTGTSSVQVRAIADNVMEKARELGIEVYNMEGYDAQRWVLIDLVDAVVHIFLPDVRKYYQLERLWGDAKVERYDDDTGEVVE